MTEEISRAVARYVLDGTDDDLRRLLRISEVLAGFAHAAIQRAGVQPGWRALECGCGPLGVLPILAEAVGPSGRVVGLDFNAGAVDRARTFMATLGVTNVEVLQADLHEGQTELLGGPYDLAYSRQFLLHQPDPARTLRRIAELLRPGGVLIAQEPFRSPGWRSHPDISYLRQHWELLCESIERAGTPPAAVEGLPKFARDAGFQVTGMSSWCAVVTPDVGLEIAMANMAAVRDRALDLRVATEQELNQVEAGLAAAADNAGDYEWISCPLVFDLAFRKLAEG